MENDCQEKKWVPIIVNQRAGPRTRFGKVARLVRLLVRMGYEAEVYRDRESFRDVVSRPEFGGRCRTIISAGGDGTLSWVVNAQTALPILVFPLGSENLFARHVGIVSSPAQVASIVQKGRTRTFDLGRINGRLFVLMASIGFDADVIDQLHLRRLGHVTKLDYAWTIWRRIWTSPFPRMTVVADGEPLPWRAAHVFVFNLPEYALGLPVCRDARGNDGMLDLVVFRRGGRLQLARYFAALLARRHRELRSVIHRKVRQVKVEGGGALAIQADGDPAGHLPATIELAPVRMTAFVP